MEMRSCEPISVDEGLMKTVRTNKKLLLWLSLANFVQNMYDEQLWEMSRVMGTHITTKDPTVQAAHTWIEPYFIPPRNFSANECPQYLFSLIPMFGRKASCDTLAMLSSGELAVASLSSV